MRASPPVHLEAVLGYLDNACGRVVQSPFKYFDLIGEILQRAKALDQKPISPIFVALIHQFNFVDEKDEKDEKLGG